ncbi:hypothetical protein J437_LFUL012232 [Ladona fulva]|uniref:Mutator-like transposase domain-containing protein n=1 Tax=Ladona fulva TaxID=123851 RepID=A0A8K0P1D5_LADFU|nr:hypothetical protein J437_LFUL012232 [Ladona fulva]
MWMKRGFGSLFHVASLIGFYTSKVIDISVKSSFCKAQSHWEKKQGTEEYYQWARKNASECLGSAGKIEVNSIWEMFWRSENLHENYIGDGGSKTYKGVVTYGETVEAKKKEFINYIQKLMGARLHVCKKGK